MKVYEEILSIYNMVDFSHILLYTYKLLKENEQVKTELNKKNDKENTIKRKNKI